MPAGPEAHAKVGLALVIDALSLSFGAAIALGLARFSYALLLPPMKADLGWTFAQAGALNTANAVGYCAGALVFPLLARRANVAHLFLGGCLATTVTMAGAAVTTHFGLLLAQRLACGVFSALVFVAGGVLAARLSLHYSRHAGLVLGLYYGGVGTGIVISALVVPVTLGMDGDAHGWQAAWGALAMACALCSVLAWPTAARMARDATEAPVVDAGDIEPPVPMRRSALLLAGYALFGIGYIGYMTFVIALLRAGGMGQAGITAFFVTLGLGTATSARLWSPMLQRSRGGGAFAVLCLLLAAATLLPALTTSPIAAFASGLVFGGTFLSVVAATTAFVRHNLMPARWSAGISLFTIVFALGQIVGPIVMGAISDGASLARGFVTSAAVLLLGAAIAAGQRPLIAAQ